MAISQLRLRRFLIAALVCLIWCAQRAYAQDNCATAVARATKSYELGNFEEVIAIVSPCIDSLISDDKWQGYRLLALAHLFRDEHAEADAAINRMLQLNPRYDRNPDRDPSEFVQALTHYDFYPEFSISGLLGLNMASPTVIRTYSVDPVSVAAPAYSGSAGATLGMAGEYRFTRVLAIGIEAQYQTSVFTRDATSAYKFTTSYTEHQSYLTIPAFAKYYFPMGRVTPFVLGGGFMKVAPSATGSLTGTDALSGTSTTVSGVSATSRRSASMLGLVFGGGVSYALGSGYATATVRYFSGLSDNVVGTERYGNNDLLYGNYYLDDDMSMRNLEFTIGFVYPITFRAYRIGEGS